MESDIFSCYCLFEDDYKGGKFAVSVKPAEYDFKDTFPYIIDNIFLPTENCRKPIFIFSLGDEMAYSLKFPGKNCEYVLMFVSKHPLYQLFYLFLSNFYDNLIVNRDSLSPKDFFTYFTTLLDAWAFFDDGDKVHVVNYDSSSDESLDVSYENTLSFNPFTYFNNVNSIWGDVISNHRICVYSKDPNLLSKAALSLRVLTLPIPYKGGVYISLNENDTTIRHFLKEHEKDQKFAIFGTTNPSLANNKDLFPILLEPKYIDHQSATKQFNIWVADSEKLMKLITHSIEMKLLDSPFFELFGKCPLELSIRRFLKAKTAARLPKVELIKEFGQTITFQDWYKKQRYRSEMRDALFNIFPEREYGQFDEEDLKRAKEALLDLSQHFSQDYHLQQILKKHFSIIDTRIEELESIEK